MEVITRNYKNYIQKFNSLKLKNNDFEMGFLYKKEINLNEIIENLNKNKILNYPKEHKLIINFENFSVLDKVLFNVKNKVFIGINKVVGKEILVGKDYSAWYDTKDGKVHISESLLNPLEKNVFVNDFTNYLSQRLNSQDYINYCILHEIGHAIQHRKLKDSNNLLFNPNNGLDLSFLNKINLYKSKNDIQRSISYVNEEGFADLFAVIAINNIYPKEQSINIIKSISKAREFANHIEAYNSHLCIEAYLSNIENIKVNSFKDMDSIISIILLETNKEILKSYFNNKINNKYMLDFCDLINTKLELNLKTTKEVVNHLNTILGLSLFVINLDLPNNTVLSNVFKMRNLNTSSTFKNKF